MSIPYSDISATGVRFGFKKKLAEGSRGGTRLRGGRLQAR